MIHVTFSALALTLILSVLWGCSSEQEFRGANGKLPERQSQAENAEADAVGETAATDPSNTPVEDVKDAASDDDTLTAESPIEGVDAGVEESRQGVLGEGNSPTLAVEEEDVVPPASGVVGAETPEEVIKTCQNAPMLELTQTLNYPPQAECEFGMNGNLGRVNEYFQAIKPNLVPQEVMLPANTILCSMELTSQKNDFRYDDNFLFNMDKFVLITSNAEMTTGLDKELGIDVWDWAKVKGKPINLDTPGYCLGGGLSTCVFPPHDQTGPVQISLDSTGISKLAVQLAGQEKIGFTLIASGDNDNGDCEHNGINFNLKLKYVQK